MRRRAIVGSDDGNAQLTGTKREVNQTGSVRRLEFDDIQHILLTRARRSRQGRELLSFRNGAGGRAWVSAIKGKIHSAASMRAGIDKDKRWVTAAFTWNGLRALGLDEASLTSFPEEFKQGMAARAEMLGDTGLNAPQHWVGGLESPDLHAIVILFARDDAEHDRCVSEHEKLIANASVAASFQQTGSRAAF